MFPLPYFTMADPIHSVEGGSQDKPSKMLEPTPIAEDAVFGEITEEGPNYRDVGILHQHPDHG